MYLIINYYYFNYGLVYKSTFRIITFSQPILNDFQNLLEHLNNTESRVILLD